MRNQSDSYRINAFEKMIWVFLITALLGDLIEMVYCRLVTGVWMSRAGVLYGPFSLVWGVGAVVLTLSLSRLANRGITLIFFVGALLGGFYEYLCSIFTEVYLGTIFWDYSHMRTSIGGGRTNLVFMACWGLLSVLWIRFCYPRLSKQIERIPPVPGKIVTWVLLLLMLGNTTLSAMAMLRYQARQDRIPAQNVVEEFLDLHYRDERIEQIWPNMRHIH